MLICIHIRTVFHYYYTYRIPSDQTLSKDFNRNLVWGQLLEIPFSIPYAHASRGISKIKLTYSESQVKRPIILGLITKNRRHHTHIPIPFFSNPRWIMWNIVDIFKLSYLGFF